MSERIGREKINIKGLFDKKECIIVTVLFIVAFLSRFILIGKVPDGLNQDEAYAAYEAYSLLHFGMDSWGYTFPVYLITWGSGMNAMNSYLMIPFMAVFGPTEMAARLPQAVLGFISVIVFYKLFAVLFPSDKKLRVLALFIVSVNPWHILMSRFALESNMAPAFILIAFYFFCKACDKPEFFTLSAVFYGLALYCYALTWILIPLFLLFQILYLIRTKRLSFSRYLIISVGILFVTSLPLMLFVLVNSGKIDEIRTAFISVPRMPMFRASEIDFGNQKYRLLSFIKSLICQNDGLPWNYAGSLGIYYIWGLPFALIGLISLTAKAFGSLIKGTYHPEVFFLLQFVICILFSCAIDANFNKLNSIHFPVIAMIVLGIDCCGRLLHKIRMEKIWLFAVAVVGAVSLILLERYYYTDYIDEISDGFKTGFKECLEYVDGIRDGRVIYFNDYSSHPCVLFYEQIPADDEYLTESRKNGISADHISDYVFDINEASEGDLCVIKADHTPGWYSRDNLLFESGRYLVVQR